ncbi:MAG: bifunctional glutamate N-acetyltransferase/amino-acid acetyltransferase ArgJ [Armatimonadetes bacterium]|nr:bifunctional glutamate N-acetyltransferase/amino-acid acetyltransferase ArgJ [Armatimonadota bacterium]
MESFRLPIGFSASGISAGLKPGGAPDMALFYSDRPCSGAAVFTRNRVVAAPVRHGQALLKRARDRLRAVVINSRNANAVTGEQGLKDARRMADLTAAALDLPPESDVFVMSTGVIGTPMPMEKIEAGIRLAAAALSPQAGPLAAAAIMTTDTRPKMASRRCGELTLSGVAKGAGMIHPDMATMLVVLMTDAAIGPRELELWLTEAVDRSFHCITVDGDTSTNDTCLLLANGAARAPDPPVFQQALIELCQDLARQIAFDGEGAEHRLTLVVRGAPDFAAARSIGRTVATSPLVKTAIFGRDANWGRILAAAGRSGVEFDPEQCSLRFAGLEVLRQGVPQPVDETLAVELLSRPDVEVVLEVGTGPGEATVWSCDLTPEYIRINAEYRT